MPTPNEIDTEHVDMALDSSDVWEEEVGDHAAGETEH
jgi:hypothetical protein